MTTKKAKVKLATPQKQFESFEKNFKKMFKLYAASAKVTKAKKPSDFICLGLNDGLLSKEAFLTSAVVFALADSTFAAKWSLARKFVQFMQSAKIENAASQRWNLERMFRLLSVAAKDFSGRAKKESVKQVAEYLMNSSYSNVLVGANSFDNVMWFNKEACESALCLFVIDGILMLGDAKGKDVLAAYKELTAAQEESGYKCALFCEVFAPKKVAVKKSAAKKTTSAKKTAAPSKISAAKKTAAKKPAAKKAAPASTKKTAASKKPATKKPAAKKTVTAKKSPAKKTTVAKKATADSKKPAVKKTAAPKKSAAVKKPTAAKKAPAKKSSSAVKKAPSKKPVAKKAPAKKSATKKTASKKK